MPGRLIQSLLEMMRLRSGPQDLPQGQSLAVILALVYIAQGFIADRVLDAPDAAPRTLVAIGIQFALITAREAVRDSGIAWNPELSRRTAVATGCALAGKVTETGGLVVWTWRLGDVELESGLRPRYAAQAEPLRSALESLTQEVS